VENVIESPGIVAVRPRPTRAFALTNRSCVIAILLSILHAFIAFTAALDKSPTFDEPAHLTAGYSHWLMRDFRLDPENAGLSSRWAALPLLVRQPNFPRTGDSWRHSDDGDVSHEFFYRSGNNPDALLFPARAMNAIVSAALCLLIFFCSRQLFGIGGGLISEVIAVFDPNLLAHGALVTSDTMAAFLFLAAMWSYWRMLHKFNARTFAFCSGAVAALFLTKMSAGLFLPMAAILAVLRIRSREPLLVFNNEVKGKSLKAAAFIVGSTIAIGIVVFVAIWAAFCFRFSAVVEDADAREVWNGYWTRLLQERTPTANVISFARDHRILPEAYLLGFAYTLKTAEKRPAFLDGNWSNVGFRSFFPRAFFYKTPLSFFLLFLIASAAAAVRWYRAPKKIVGDLLRIAPLAVLVLVYFGVALSSKLNIGHRHLLPIYPPFFIACGACAWWLRNTKTRFVPVLISVAIFCHAAQTLAIHPDYLAYFNPIAGGPARGYEHLVDSSLDWGQDLLTLSEWLRENVKPRDPVYLGYFGSADPESYGIRATLLPRKLPDAAPLHAGVYCISATILQHVYEPEHGRWVSNYEDTYRRALAWHDGYRKIDNSPVSSLDQARSEVFQRLQFARLCALLRHRKPDAEIGYSILVFIIDDTTLQKALFGPSPE